jgi:hypothetical protein
MAEHREDRCEHLVEDAAEERPHQQQEDEDGHGVTAAHGSKS